VIVFLGTFLLRRILPSVSLSLSSLKRDGRFPFLRLVFTALFFTFLELPDSGLFIFFL